MDRLEMVLLVITGLALLFAVGVIWFCRRRSRQQLNGIQTMLEQAMAGTFPDMVLDESLLSAVTARFAQYLSASELKKKKLAQEEAHIQELIADISHQTKTPIANLLLYTQLLQEQNLPEESQSCVAALCDQVRKLQFFIDTMIKTSRLEVGALALRPTFSAIWPMLDDIRRQIAPRAVEKGITITVEPTTAMASFDQKWTTEAIYNIADNAVKYTASGGSIRIFTVEYGLFCGIHIQDTGIGISEEEQAQVFQRFYRSPTVSQTEGLGIGLYLSRQILSSEDGYIKLRSKPGEGTTFSIFLRKESEFCQNC